VGKTSIAKALENNTPLDDFKPQVTVAYDFIHIEYGSPPDAVALRVIDPQGTDQGILQTSVFFRGLDAVMAVFDVTNRDTYTRLLDSWLATIDSKATKEIALIVLANKMDMVRNGTARLQVNLAQIEQDIKTRWPTRFRLFATVETTIKDWNFPAAIEPIDAFIQERLDEATARAARERSLPGAREKPIQLFETDLETDTLKAQHDTCNYCK
jgi:GTPase SAR1 family protein